VGSSCQHGPGGCISTASAPGQGQFFITKGELLYEVGSAPAGTYGYEPVFAEHYQARCEVETEMLFLGSGAVTYFKTDKTIDYVFGAESLIGLCDGSKALDIGS
jgi:hypothetical protein